MFFNTFFIDSGGIVNVMPFLFTEICHNKTQVTCFILTTEIIKLESLNLFYFRITTEIIEFILATKIIEKNV